MFTVKFHDRADKNKPIRYTKLTGDGEPLTIVHTIIAIMQQYAERYPKASFSFIASRGANETGEVSKRFRLYHRIILTYFSDSHFYISYDPKLSLYLMLCRSEVESGNLTLSDVLTYINEEYII